MDQARIEQLNKWHEEDEQQRIVDLLLAVPEEERDYEAVSRLGRALNNLGLYEEALNELKKIAEAGQKDSLWHHRVGFALYHLKRYEEAMLSENKKKKLELIVRENQFEHAMDYLKESVRQGIRLSKKEMENYNETCSSRIGGDPDLPPNVEWPLDSNGTPMTFLAQLRLRELASHDESSLLPAGGMLYFFVGVDEPSYHIEHKVLYLQEEKLQEAKRQPSPEVTALEEEFAGYRVTARATIEPPNYGYVEYEQVEDGEHDYEQYEELCFELTGGNSSDLAVLFGYPATQHGDCEYEAALRLLTGEKYNYSVKAAMEQITAHLNGNSDKAEQEVRDTLLLLALDSDQEVGFCWWDAGELQFYIRKEDLLAGNFAHTYCSLYSS